MMILLGAYTGWRALHSEYYLKGDRFRSSDSILPTAHTPLLLPAAARRQGLGDEVKVEEGRPSSAVSSAAAATGFTGPVDWAQQQAKAEAKADGSSGGGGDGGFVTWLQGLKERMLATVVGTVHGVAGAYRCLSAADDAPAFPSTLYPNP